MLYLLLGCLSARQLGKIESASQPLLLDMIENGKYGYLREKAILQLNSVQTIDWNNTDISPLIHCVENSQEYSYIRSQCAYALATMHHLDSIPSILDAIDECDDEARYWMLLSLEKVALDSPLARGEIAELKHDPDIFISAEAQRWLRENQ